MLYWELRRHQKLANKRHPMFDKNRFAKIFTYLFVGIWMIYLLFIGLFLPTILQNAYPGIAPYHLFNQGLFYFLALDFLLRFLFQKIPVQEIKPYILFPIKRKQLIRFFLIRSGLSFYNLFWFALLIPLAFTGIFKYHGITGVSGFLIGCWGLFLINDYWYLLCKTLINERLLFLLLPILVYGGCIAIDLLFPESKINHFTMTLGEGFILWNPLYWIFLLFIISLLFRVNLGMQQHYIYKELAKVDPTRLKHIFKYKFLDRWGEIGEYIRLEIKLRSRNKAVRTQFRNGLIFMFFFSMVLSFSSIYDNGFMKNFICIYNFAVLGVMTLVHIMNVEGNYLDGLISRKESILSLLKAKYYFNIALLIIPFLLCIPAILNEKITLLTSLTYLFMTSGPLYAMLFQLAVYNNRTFPLDTQVTGRNTTGSSYQSLITAAAFFIPILLNNIFCWMWGETIGQIILLTIGITLTLTHNWWLQNIYKRFMKRRYINMDRFRSTR